MFSYTISQWVLFFYVYCFIGWIIESTIVSVEEKKFVNRGFLRIPLLPIYGFGALAMLFSTLWIKENPTLVFVFGALSASILEYFTGMAMEIIFKVKYWDYSDIKYNIKGRICLLTSFFWGFLTLFLMYQLHELVEKIVVKFSETGVIISITIISLVFVADIFYSVKTAFSVKDVLAKLTELRNELEEVISDKVDNSETAQALKEKANVLKLERQKLFLKLSYYPRSLINAHPRATSSKFSEALKELKVVLKNRKN